MLPPETSRLWGRLKTDPLLGGFILVGGSGLSIQISHRRSEDLDFAWPGAKLPGGVINALLEQLRAEGHGVQTHDDPAVEDEFAEVGLDLRDYQRDVLIGTVKVSFFVPEDRDFLAQEKASGPRLGSLDEIFALKCLATAARNASRDWVDLYVLMANHGYRMDDIVSVFHRAGKPASADIAIQKLCRFVPSSGDPGYASLMDVPVDAERMRNFFIQARDDYQIRAAEHAFREVNERGQQPKEPYPGDRSRSGGRTA